MSRDDDDADATSVRPAGFEVWLGNNRGNGYSMRHKVYTTADPAFWHFTYSPLLHHSTILLHLMPHIVRRRRYDDMAQYDLPANINFILKTSGAASLSYVGHSEVREIL